MLPAASTSDKRCRTVQQYFVLFSLGDLLFTLIAILPPSSMERQMVFGGNQNQPLLSQRGGTATLSLCYCATRPTPSAGDWSLIYVASLSAFQAVVGDRASP